MLYKAFHRRLLLHFSKAACWLALLFLHPQSAGAQGWLRHYSPGSIVNFAAEPTQLVFAPNGDFVFAGEGYSGPGAPIFFYLQRNDPAGNPLWLKTVQVPLYYLYFLENCPGGGFVGGGIVRTGGIDSEIVFRVSESGDALWTLMPAPGIKGNVYTAVPTPDGKLLVGGTRRLGVLSLLTPVLYKIDPADGSVLWSESYPGHPANQFGSSVLYAPDGTIVQAGIGLDTVFIRQMDAGGQLLRTIATKNSPSDYPILRRALNDGYSFIMPENTTAIFRRYNYDGQLLASNVTDSVAFLVRAGAENTAGFAFTLSPINPLGFRTPVLWKMDFDGHFAPPASPLAGFSVGVDYIVTNVKSTPDGGFLFVGANIGQPTWFALKTDSTGHLDGGVLRGNVFRDDDADCALAAGEQALYPVLVRASDPGFGSPWYETTDSAGNYAFRVPLGDYDVGALAPGNAAGFWQPCPPEQGLLLLPGDTLLLPPLGLQPLSACPYLQVDIGAGLFRPCSTTVLTVRVSNFGTLDADSSTVLLEVDSALSLVSSTAPLIAHNGNQYWFDAGPVATLQHVQFSASFEVNCDLPLGQVICVDAHVSPDSLCAPASPLWDGAELKIRAQCAGDSVYFRVSNIGTGGMGQTSDLVIIEDYIILFSLPLQLPAGQDTLIALHNPAGRTYYGRIRQTPGFPGDAYASDGKDFCAADGTPGMLLQYPLSGGGPFDDRFCDEVRTSFDPNDKRGFPFGYGPAHYIDRGTPIRYMIRFQNTGNDTAFQVVVRDTLPAQLDLTTLRVGSASHPCSWALSGEGVLVFRFNPILLPDSTTNEPASHGFVQFEIFPKKDLPAGTAVHNGAAIYFDFNAPVFTDVTGHTVDSNFILVRTLHAPLSAARVSAQPNPAAGETTLELEFPDGRAPFPLVLTLRDVFGNTLRQELVAGGKHLLRRDAAPAGLYLLTLADKQGHTVALGKLVWVGE